MSMSGIIGGTNQSAASALTGGASGVNTITGAATKSKAASEDSAAVTNFMNYMKESPAQRIEDMWLAAHGLTKEKLAAMSPQQRDAAMKQMADDIKKQMQQTVQNAQKTGSNSVAAALG